MKSWMALGAACLALAGCPAESVDCTLAAAASVTVTVLDEDGAIVLGADVRYAVDGGEERACEPIGDTWACGWEEAGAFVITASADGFEVATGDVVVVVAEGECHVEGQALELILTEEAPTG